MRAMPCNKLPVHARKCARCDAIHCQHEVKQVDKQELAMGINGLHPVPDYTRVDVRTPDHSTSHRSAANSS